jgi:hypothetical protein
VCSPDCDRSHTRRYTQIKEWAFDNASALVWGSDISQPSDERHRLFEIFESMNKGLGGCLPIKVRPLATHATWRCRLRLRR